MTADPGDGYPGDLKTARTTVRQQPNRAAHDWETIAAILDEGMVCHIAFEVDGQPYAIPTIYGRDGRTLYIHGSTASRLLGSLSNGIPICFTVTLIDGLVLGRSLFHHSMNYRSVVVLGRVHKVEDPAEKLRGLEVVSDHLIPGRWQDARIPNDRELRITDVLRMEIEEASAKIRPGGPIDEPEDMDLSVWAGRIPLSLVAGEPQADAELRGDLPAPPYLQGYSRPQK